MSSPYSVRRNLHCVPGISCMRPAFGRGAKVVYAIGFAALSFPALADTPVPTPTPATSTIAFSASVVAAAPTPSTPAEVEATIKKILNEFDVDVRVLVGTDGKYSAVITGKDLKADQIKFIQNLIGNRKVVPNLVTDVVYRFESTEEEQIKKEKQAEQEATDRKKAKAESDAIEARLVTEVWPLTFTPETVNAAQANGATASEAAERYRIDTLVETLNERYGKKDAPVVRATRNSLVIRAPLRTVLNIKRDLVKLDAPGPQVQLDTWAVQVSGKGKEIEQAVETINTRLARARQSMQMVHFELQQVVHLHADAITKLYGNPANSNAEDYPNFKHLDRVYELDEKASFLKTKDGRRNSTVKDLEAEIAKLKLDITALTDEIKTITQPSIKERLEKELKAKQDLQPKLEDLADHLKRIQNERIAALDQIRVLDKELEDPEDWLNLQLLHHLSRTAQFNVEPRRSLSLTEMFIFISMMRVTDRVKLMKALEDRARDDKTSWYNLARRDKVILGKIPDRLYPQLHEVLLPSDLENRKTEPFKISVGNFLLALRRYNALDRALAAEASPAELSDFRHKQAPEWLAQQAAAVDGLLALVVEALSDDLQRALLKPLVESINEVGIKERLAGRGKGTALLGRTRLVVTSGLESGLAPTLTATVNVATPTSLTVDEVVKSTGKDTNLATLFENLSTPQLALVGTLLKETPPVYAEVAPGVGLNVRPTVMPGSSHARLQLNARFGVQTKFPGRPEGRDDVTTTQPFDAVQTHHVSTDAIISGLDLFGISSFNIETRTPRTPFVTPVLGRIPLVGALFRFPRNDTRISHHSVILVNTVILPRTLDIVRFYGGGDPSAVNFAGLYASPGSSATPDNEKNFRRLLIPSD